MKYAIKVIWNDGEEEMLKEGDKTALFMNRKRAQEQADFMRIGMEGECQSINVVPYHIINKKEAAALWRSGCAVMNAELGLVERRRAEKDRC